MLRSKFTVLMIGIVMAFGSLAASFAEAGTLAINQACYATQPQAHLTAINTTTDIVALAPADKRSPSEAATLILASTHLNPSAMTDYDPVYYLPSVALSVHRSTIFHIVT